MSLRSSILIGDSSENSKCQCLPVLDTVSKVQSKRNDLQLKLISRKKVEKNTDLIRKELCVSNQQSKLSLWGYPCSPSRR